MPDVVDGGSGGAEAVGGLAQLEQGGVGPAGGVLDGQPGHAGFDGAGDVGRHALDVVGVAGLEVGVERQVGGADQVGHVVEHVVERQGGRACRADPERRRTRRWCWPAPGSPGWPGPGPSPGPRGWASRSSPLVQGPEGGPTIDQVVGRRCRGHRVALRSCSAVEEAVGQRGRSFGQPGIDDRVAQGPLADPLQLDEHGRVAVEVRDGEEARAGRPPARPPSRRGRRRTRPGSVLRAGWCRRSA